MKTFSKLFVVVGILLAQVSPASAMEQQAIKLLPAEGEDFVRLGARSLNAKDGSAQVEIERVSFAPDRMGFPSLDGRWNGIRFESIAAVAEPSGVVEFWFELIRQESPCADGYYESGVLRLAPVSGGDSGAKFKVLSGEISVKRTKDNCHLSPEGPSIRLTPES